MLQVGSRYLDFMKSSRDKGLRPVRGRMEAKAGSVVHLSVAIGRFFEALLWALARGVGMMAGWAVLGAILLGVLVVLLRAGWRRR